MSTVLYPGTFNPIHNGHADLVQRASLLFDRVVLGIATSPQKDPSVLELRVELAEKALAHLSNVEVRGFNTLTVDFAKEVGAGVILKGIRTVTDFEYEFQMLNMNRVLAPGLETVFFGALRGVFLHFLNLGASNRLLSRRCQQFCPSCCC